MSEQPAYEGWAILELMGHRKLAGYVQPVELAGAGVLRIDIPAEPPVTQFYSPQAMYALTPCSEAVARRYSEGLTYAPVSRYELPAPRSEEPGDEAAMCVCGHVRDLHRVDLGPCRVVSCLCSAFQQGAVFAVEETTIEEPEPAVPELSEELEDPEDHF